MKKRKIVPPSNLQNSILHETGYTIWPRASLTCNLFPLTTTLVCSSWRCQAWSYLRAFALVIPSTWTALPPGISQAFFQRSPSQWFSPTTIWNHNSSLSFSLTHMKYPFMFYLVHLIYHHLFYLSVFFSYETVSSFKIDFFFLVYFVYCQEPLLTIPRK